MVKSCKYSPLSIPKHKRLNSRLPVCELCIRSSQLYSYLFTNACLTSSFDLQIGIINKFSSNSTRVVRELVRAVDLDSVLRNRARCEGGHSTAQHPPPPPYPTSSPQFITCQSDPWRLDMTGILWGTSHTSLTPPVCTVPETLQLGGKVWCQFPSPANHPHTRAEDHINVEDEL